MDKRKGSLPPGEAAEDETRRRAAEHGRPGAAQPQGAAEDEREEEGRAQPESSAQKGPARPGRAQREPERK